MWKRRPGCRGGAARRDDADLVGELGQAEGTAGPGKVVQGLVARIQGLRPSNLGASPPRDLADGADAQRRADARDFLLCEGVHAPTIERDHDPVQRGATPHREQDVLGPVLSEQVIDDVHFLGILYFVLAANGR